MKPAPSPNISAGSIAIEASTFRPFVPLRPRFLNELVVVPFKEELVIEGKERFQAVEASGAYSILPDLIRLMNGKRTLEELKSALPGTSEEDLLDTISSLYHWGLIEEGALNSESPGSNVDTLSFLRRYLGISGSNRSGTEAYEKLRNSEVLIFEPDNALPGTAILKPLLDKSGIGRVVELGRRPPSKWGARASASVARTLCVSLSFSGEECGWHQDLDDWCFQQRLPWLRVVLWPSKHSVDFGPLFAAGKTPCYRCFREVHSAMRGSGPELNGEEIAVEIHFWTALAAVEVLYFLSGMSAVVTQRSVERFDLQRQTSRRFPLVRIPGCPRCRQLEQNLAGEPGTGPLIGAIHSAIVFEDSISMHFRPRSPSSVEEDYTQIGTSLAKQAKRMPNCTHVHLPRTLSLLDQPALEVLDHARHAAHHVITLEDLSTTLMVTAGLRSLDLRDGKVQRWAATAGNLGSVELFAIVRHVEGLTPGVYFYESANHSLAHFQQRGRMTGIRELMECVAVFDRREAADALVLFTGAYHRLEKKYGEFAYKLTHLDAGVAVSQLHLTAKGLGLFSLTALGWADDLIEQSINLEPHYEQVTAVVALYATSGTPTTTLLPLESRIAENSDTVPLKQPVDFCELELRQIEERLFQESRISERYFHSLPWKSSSGWHKTPRGLSSSLTLPPSENRGGLSVNDVLARRTTVRNYVVDPVSPQQLATMLDYAHRGDQEQWSGEHHAEPLTLYVLAWRLTHFEPAVYVYDADNHGLRLVAPARSLHDSMELFVQTEFASAAVVIWIAGDLAAACARLGSLGHRYLLLRAGSAGHRLWTAALAMGLAGGITAGIVNGVAREHFGLDGYRKLSLLAFATGFQAGTKTEDSGAALDGEPK